MQNPLKNIPSLGEILENPAVKSLLNKISHGEIVSTTLNVMDELRSRAALIATQRTLPTVTEIADLIAKRITQGDPSQIGAVINATGELFPETLGPPPLAEEAVNTVTAFLSDYPGMGEPLSIWNPRRQEMSLEKLLNKLTGAESTIVLNSTAAGILLMFSTFSGSEKKKIVISRGHLYESRRRKFRVTDLARAVSVPLCEIGTTNRTLATDYSYALAQEDTAFTFYAFPGHFSVTGASEMASLSEVIKVSHPVRKPVFVDLGLGGLIDMDAVLGSSLPSAKKALKEGADLVLISGDYMLNGPACAILAGNRELIQMCKENPFAPAFSCPPLVQTALEATLEKYMNAQSLRTSVPILQLLDTPIENLRYRAQRIVRRLEPLSIIGQVNIRTVLAQIFNGFPETPLLETVQICIRPNNVNGMDAPAIIGRIANRLSASRPAVWGNLEHDTLVLDLRCVFPRQDAALVEAFEKLPGADSVDL
ncbi:MAG: hypothetical protein Q4C96_02025 [Planctomycetia bacterium]|nr:hypothetical protein [Planctomycetia bacterium]